MVYRIHYFPELAHLLRSKEIITQLEDPGNSQTADTPTIDESSTTTSSVFMRPYRQRIRIHGLNCTTPRKSFFSQNKAISSILLLQMQSDRPPHQGLHRSQTTRRPAAFRNGPATDEEICQRFNHSYCYGCQRCHACLWHQPGRGQKTCSDLNTPILPHLAPTLLRPEHFCRLVFQHPDGAFVSLLLQNIGYRGPHFTRSANNCLSATPRHPTGKNQQRDLPRSCFRSLPRSSTSQQLDQHPRCSGEKLGQGSSHHGPRWLSR